MKLPIIKPGEALAFRTCNADMTAHGGFVWPRKGRVKAKDWDAKAKCGNGLHGLLWGEGDGGLLNWTADAVWMVVKVRAAKCVDLGGKVKFPSCEVVYAGDRATATGIIHAIRPGRIEGLIAAGGNYATLTGGNRSTLTGGDRSTLTGGYRSTLTGGDYATLTGGNYATLTGGYHATLTGGYCATLTGGYCATLTGGDEATLTGGYRATLCWKVWDGGRYRMHVRYVGEDGIKPNTPYRFEDGKVKEVKL